MRDWEWESGGGRGWGREKRELENESGYFCFLKILYMEQKVICDLLSNQNFIFCLSIFILLVLPYDFFIKKINQTQTLDLRCPIP